MTEYYAKIVPMQKGMFRYCVTIWKSHDGIESICNVKKFFNINSAKVWSEKMLTKLISINSSVMFIKDNDIIRRKWND